MSGATFIMLGLAPTMLMILKRLALGAGKTFSGSKCTFAKDITPVC
jgi:hypothetical protein